RSHLLTHSLLVSSLLHHRALPSFPTRRSSDLPQLLRAVVVRARILVLGNIVRTGRLPPLPILLSQIIQDLSDRHRFRGLKLIGRRLDEVRADLGGALHVLTGLLPPGESQKLLRILAGQALASRDGIPPPPRRISNIRLTNDGFCRFGLGPPGLSQPATGSPGRTLRLSPCIPGSLVPFLGPT